MTLRLRTSMDGDIHQLSTSRRRSPTFWSSALDATTISSSVYFLCHPVFYIVQAAGE